MPIDRFYLKGSYQKDNIVTLEDEEFHHLSRVMRKKEGERVELVNGEGLLAEASIQELHKRKATLAVESIELHKPEIPPLILIQALPKLSNLELIIQKGTELGVSDFYVFPSERSEKKDLSEQQKKRLNLIKIGAMKQCGRFDLPSFHFVPNLKNLSLPEGNAFFGDLRSSIPLPKSQSPYQLFIGPEKGFTKKEHLMFEKLFQAQGIRFHPYTLRAETAAIAALALAASF